MPLNQLALLELTEAMRTADDGKLMRTLLHTILQALVDAEATGHIEAGMHEQNDTRTTQRSSLLRHLNGHDCPKYRHERREPGQSMTETLTTASSLLQLATDDRQCHEECCEEHRQSDEATDTLRRRQTTGDHGKGQELTDHQTHKEPRSPHSLTRGFLAVRLKLLLDNHREEQHGNELS